MLLAIPFQGIASAAMLTCAHDAGQAPQHAAPMQHADAASGHCQDAEADVQATSSHAQQPGDHEHDSRCSACAACCMGAAMAPAPAVAPAPQTSPTRLIAAATGRLAAVDLAHPERPPRFPLA